jgi:hypothetical protein
MFAGKTHKYDSKFVSSAAFIASILFNGTSEYIPLVY